MAGRSLLSRALLDVPGSLVPANYNLIFGSRTSGVASCRRLHVHKHRHVHVPVPVPLCDVHAHAHACAMCMHMHMHMHMHKCTCLLCMQKYVYTFGSATLSLCIVNHHTMQERCKRSSSSRTRIASHSRSSSRCC